MKGTVHSINARRGMIAFLTDGNGFSIFETADVDEFSLGDTVSWSDSDEVKNLSTGERVDGTFQNHGVSVQNLQYQMMF